MQHCSDPPARSRAASFLTPRLALQVSLAVAWVNFLGTGKWAAYAGALNGWKRPWYALVLAAATALSFLPGSGRGRVRLGRLAVLAAAGGACLLAFAFLSSFPPSSWWRLPFEDDWPPRFQSTIDGIELLRRGAWSGWQWAFLGGYHTSSNVSQALTLVALVPVELFGERLGFHLLHALLVAAIPALLYWDMKQDGAPDVAWLTAAFACVTATGIFGTIVPSGDTNSVAGMVCALVALAGSRAARLGRPWGPPLLVAGLALALYSHQGFFFYAAVALGVEALFYRDARGAWRTAAALAVAVVAGLPLYWETLRYPGYTNTNNVIIAPGAAGGALQLARKFYYNVEMLVQPHRWYNDYYSLALVFLAALIVLAWQGRPRSRGRFYAWAAVAMIALVRLDAPQFGYLFIRPVHMLALFAPPALAFFVSEYAGRRGLAVALVALVGLYVQASFAPVPHVNGIRDFDAALVDRVASLPGNLILLENSPHRAMSLVPGVRTERPRFDTHFEAYLAASTGRRFYASEWDGWVWSRYRFQTVAGGFFRGRPLSATPLPEFVAEMRRWGVRHALVWSRPANDYLGGGSELAKRWSSGPWSDYELLHADDREVVVPAGQGRVEARDMLGADIVLEDARAGDTVLVRTNYYPAWQASADGRPVSLFDSNGQVAFRAPRSGSLRVRLAYPRRTGLLAGSWLAFVCGAILLIPLRGGRE